MDNETSTASHAHRDPITGEPGAHPVGVGVGAAAGGAAVGAAVGTAVGPVGTAIGIAAGAIAGAIIGKSAAERIDPSVEDAYWRDHWARRDDIAPGRSYDEDYAPAYRYGVDAYASDPDRSFDEREADLATGWSAVRGRSRLEWDEARHAARDAWRRVRGD